MNKPNDIPIAPMLPIMSAEGWQWSPNRGSSAFLDEECFLLHGARYALLSGLRAMGVNVGAHVLLPAYHCYSMVEPFIQHGCAVEFYKLTSALTIDLDDLRSRLTDRTRAVLFTHFFAVPSDVDGLVEATQEYDVLLIEDCAHAFFGNCFDRQFGTHGHFSVASGKKFFPVEDGGILRFNRKPPRDVNLRRGSGVQNLKLLVNSIERSEKHHRLTPLSSFVSYSLQQFHRLNLNRPGSQDSTEAGNAKANRGQTYMDNHLLDRQGSGISRWIMEHTDVDLMRSKRRKYFNKVLSEISSLRDARPLIHDLAEESVPYVVPILLNDPRSQFPLLKERRVPVWRWEDVKISHCDVSRSYRERLIQLPCHQSLTSAEVDAVIDRVLSVLR